MNAYYEKDYKALAENFDLNVSSRNISISGHRDFEMFSFPFKSHADFVYPEAGDYSEKGSAFTALLKYYCKTNKYSDELIFKALENPDRNITENNNFRIPVFRPAGDRRSSNAIFLLHGLNEKRWEKYLPWALKIMEETGSPVIMFPVAFHMNRAPEAWGSPRKMIRVAAERKHLVPDETATSFANAALSYRIQFAPHRFFSSGMQTYYDIISFINEIRMGGHPLFESNCRFDFFSYSIGALLTEVLMTSNYKNYFDDSKAFLFCGGAALDTADPVSKTIIDKAAYTELFRWLATLYESATEISKRVKEIFFQELPEVLNFKSFLFYDRMQSFRETALKRTSNRIKELGLVKDSVFPPDITARTLNGISGDIAIETQSMDFPYTYRHEEPFPLIPEIGKEVNLGFEQVFADACGFLNQPV